MRLIWKKWKLHDSKRLPGRMKPSDGASVFVRENGKLVKKGIIWRWTALSRWGCAIELNGGMNKINLGEFKRRWKAKQTIEASIHLIPIHEVMESK